MPPGRITTLISEIQEHGIKVDEFIQSNGLPQPTFDPEYPSVPPPLPESIAASVQKTLEAADELHELLLGPLGFILHQLDGTHNLISLHFIVRFKIAQQFPLNTTISILSLSKNCSVPLPSMTRILLHAISNHIFTSPQPGYIAHTSISAALLSIPKLHEWIAVSCEEMWAPTTKLVDAISLWPGSSEPNETAYNLSSSARGSFFEELGKSKERTERFSDAMTLFKMMPGFGPELVVDSEIWNSIPPDGTVVDVGGADGALASVLASKYPNLGIIVQDLPHVIENAMSFQNTASETGTGISSEISSDTQLTNIKYQAHDFFTEQPVKNANVYIFRMIFHDWSNPFCERILRALIPAFKSGAKILVNDFCIPEPGESSLYTERLARCHDLSMKALFNGKERSGKDWKSLFENVDERFQVRGVKQPLGSALALFEMVWDGIVEV